MSSKSLGEDEVAVNCVSKCCREERREERFQGPGSPKWSAKKPLAFGQLETSAAELKSARLRRVVCREKPLTRLTPAHSLYSRAPSLMLPRPTESELKQESRSGVCYHRKVVAEGNEEHERMVAEQRRSY